MKLHTVGTGSKGNCYLLQRDNDRFIALDCGCPWKKVMITAKFMPSLIDFALVTHIHGDHSKYVNDFRKNGIQVFAQENMQAKKKYTPVGVTVIPFEVPHDVPCYAYLIRVDGRVIVYMTDFGYCKYTLKSWNADTWIIACDYNIAPDRTEAKYAHVVMGHSSLETVKDILEANRCDSMRNVVLVHYNEDADTEQMATEVQTVVGDGVNVKVARKGEVIEL